MLKMWLRLWEIFNTRSVVGKSNLYNFSKHTSECSFRLIDINTLAFIDYDIKEKHQTKYSRSDDFHKKKLSRGLELAQT